MTIIYTIQMMAWLEQERLEGERELGEGDPYVVYQVTEHLLPLVDTWLLVGLLESKPRRQLTRWYPTCGRYLATRCSTRWKTPDSVVYYLVEHLASRFSATLGLPPKEPQG